MHELLNEPVDVLVAFEQRRVRPRLVRWNKRDYHITSVNLVHSAREGAQKIYYFSVSDKTTFFKLRLATETLEWRLIEMYCE